ncbi:MAG TPA: glycosyltransferase family 39 protein [Bryobacteraceae bacterium]|nr:glycosyltransferase family 39 protein [Bryobacteraceae bacterium]
MLAALAVALAALGAISVLWCAREGYTLYYGDAEAHLNIARRILDSRTPGGEQFGTVWLPLPHLLMIPFVASDAAWRNGWPGAIPAWVCFVAAGAFLFSAARRCYGPAAGFTAAALFALNPNMLYLASTPMTEPIFAAALAALLWATLRYRDSPSLRAAIAAAAASNAASLTRYEGWFLIPFVALYFFFVHRKRDAITFAALASLGPLAWLAHNQYYYSNAFEFYNGPFSAAAIYARQIAQGIERYPGDHAWLQAIHYYFAAVKLTLGPVALGAALPGASICMGRGYRWPVALLALPPIFYVWSIHSGATPLYVPDLWPHSWYNTRYALAALPLVAFTGGAFVGSLPRHWRLTAGALLTIASVAALGWSGRGSNGQGIVACWTESEVNSIARRVWTEEAAAYLAANYRPGTGIIYSFGDLTGVLRVAGIPLKEGLHDGNHPAWDVATARPELFLHEEWALTVAGDAVSRTILRANRGGPHYELRKRVIVKGAPVIELYQREPYQREPHP